MKRQVSRHAISENFDICIFLYNPVDTEENRGREGWGGGRGSVGPQLVFFCCLFIFAKFLQAVAPM